MKKLTIKDILGLHPCYPPTKYLAETWSGTVIDILDMTEVPASDRLWVVIRSEFLSDTILKRYGLACARQCEKNADDSDVMYCNDIVEAFLDGHATQEEVSAAESAAWSARSARSAARSAAESAAESAAWSAWSAAWSAESAAWSARSAWSAWSAESAAWSAVQEEQCVMLIDIIWRFS